MPVTTRYQHNAALYADVLENPLILQNIFQHLRAKDTLNVMITNAPFTKEERFKDILNRFLDEKKEIYEKEVQKKRFDDCMTNIKSFINTFETMQHARSSITQLITQLCRLYDYLFENKWFMEEYSKFAKVVEKQIIGHLHMTDFLLHGLKYMRQLFDISEQMEENEFGEECWFVITTDGDKVYF